MQKVSKETNTQKCKHEFPYNRQFFNSSLMCILASLSVDEILLSRYGLPISEVCPLKCKWLFVSKSCEVLFIIIIKCVIDLWLATEVEDDSKSPFFDIFELYHHCFLFSSVNFEWSLPQWNLGNSSFSYNQRLSSFFLPHHYLLPLF